MTTRVKILLLWLLALAIPIQGYAAAVQIACAPTYQAEVQTQAQIQTTPASMDAHHHTGHTGHTGHDVQAAAQADTVTDIATQHQQHQHKSSAASCSSCSVCTIGAILPLALDKLINLPVTSDIHVALAQHGFVGYTPENPERPPSHLV